MNCLFGKGALALCLAMSTSIGAAASAPVESIPISARTLALGGSGLASVHSATALALNPSGMAFSDLDARNTGEFVVTGVTSYENEGLGPDDDFGLFWAKRYSKWAFGLGYYNTQNMSISFFDIDSNSQLNAILQSYDISANLAYVPVDDLKVGASLKIISVKEKDISDNVRDETSEYGLQLGAGYRLFNKPIDFSSSSGQLSWDAGVTYHFESTQTYFEESQNHPLNKRKISVYPESLSVGSSISFGWIFSATSFQINLNTDLEKLKYSEMSDLFFATQDSFDVEITKKKLGAEFLIGDFDSKSTFSLRAGITEQSSNCGCQDEEKRISAGIGFVASNFSIDIGVQQYADNVKGGYRVGMLEVGIEL